MSVGLKVFIACVIEAVLFGAAGTLEWGAGWAWLVLMFGGGMVTVLIARRDPALLAERMRSPMQPDQPLWDKVFLVAMGIAWCAWLVLMGLDAVRFRWSAMPLWFASVGSALVVVSFLARRAHVSGEHVSRACREDSVGARASRDIERALCNRAPSALCGGCDHDSRERARTRLLVWTGIFHAAAEWSGLSHADGRA